MGTQPSNIEGKQIPRYVLSMNKTNGLTVDSHYQQPTLSISEANARKAPPPDYDMRVETMASHVGT